jgi:hypothetical protein
MALLRFEPPRRDMWLTGFDAPCLHTMYVDKPMKEHNLMQAIARVNRVFKDKPGVLIIDYIGIGTSLKKALSFYAESGGKGMPAKPRKKPWTFCLKNWRLCVRCSMALITGPFSHLSSLKSCWRTRSKSGPDIILPNQNRCWICWMVL